MGIFTNWTYTNLHELNLDWLIRQMKELGTNVDSYKANTEALSEQLTGLDTQTLQTVIDKINEIENLNVVSNNIKDWGADGTTYTDNTPYLQAMVAAGIRRIYIPNGNYYFKNCEFYGLSDLYLYGEGTIYNMREEANGQLYTSFTFSQCGKIIFDGLDFSSVQAYDIAGADEYRVKTAQIRFLSCHYCAVINAQIGGPYNWYNTPVSSGNLPYIEREGCFLTVRDCQVFNFSFNKISTFYSEFMWVQSTNWPGENYATVHDNIYLQRVAASDSGSAFDMVGGLLHFYDNTVTSTFTMTGGSLFNNIAAYAFIHDNDINTYAGGFIDCCEMGSVATEVCIATNNKFGSPTGASQYATRVINGLKINANLAIIANNYFATTIGITILNSSTIKLGSNYFNYGTHRPGDVLIDNNIFDLKAYTTTTGTHYKDYNMIHIYSTDLNSLKITNNTFKNEYYVPIFIAAPITSIYIENNIIQTGFFSSTLDRMSAVALADFVWQTDYQTHDEVYHNLATTTLMSIKNNHIVNTNNAITFYWIWNNSAIYYKTAEGGFNTWVICVDNITDSLTIPCYNTANANTVKVKTNNISEHNILDITTYTSTDDLSGRVSTLENTVSDLSDRVYALEHPTP